MSQHTQALCAFLTDLDYPQLPEAVISRTQELFLDWLGSALASQGAHPIPLFERYAAKMGPASGPAGILVNGQTTSAYFAALVNGASSHLVEQDDLHNSSVLHPATVVFPAVLAAPSPVMKRAFASVSFLAARITASFTPRPRSAPWRQRWVSAS